MTPEKIRPAYEEHGARGYYEKHGAHYRNPHEPVVAELTATMLRRHPPEAGCILDLACGSGEVTLALRAANWPAIAGIDPFTGAAYKERTSLVAESVTFEEIAGGALSGRQYATVFCSFALHLMDSSRLPGLLFHLAEITPSLFILTPHKRPDIRPQWGWELQDEIREQRVRARFYTRCQRVPSPAAPE